MSFRPDVSVQPSPGGYGPIGSVSAGIRTYLGTRGQIPGVVSLTVENCDSAAEVGEPGESTSDEWERVVKATQSAKRLSGDDGAALIEGALVAGPFFLLVFGILEFGLLFKDHLSVAAVATSSARSASTLGSYVESDFRILEQIDKRAAGLNRRNIHTIVIWHATGPGDPVPAGCLDGTGQDGAAPPGRSYGACNVYDYTDLAGWDVSDFDCDPASGPADYNWCASDRKDFIIDDPDTAWDDAGTDYVGVYVAADYSYITGLFGDTATLSSSSIIPIEPQSLGNTG